MRMYDIIYKKRMGEPLTREEIEFAINGYVKDEIPDYQISALLMAICFNGMSKEETYNLTDIMMKSGDVVDLSSIDGICVDKHSTGGVGDKTTLIVAPIVAALNAKVAKMSGRGLGFTGGTVDKLESIPGYRTSLSSDEFLNNVRKCGVAVTGQSGNLAPADKKLYALRDVTATVDSIPLIASSIMSKKLASGADTIVLDVKTGNGAFMKTYEGSLALAEAMVDIGKGFGKNIRALITDMSAPLGMNIGNSLEVKEAITVLKGEGDEDLYGVCIALSANIISAAFGIEYSDAEEKCKNAIANGSALSKMKEWIAMQGGDVSYIDDPDKLPISPNKKDYFAKSSGYVAEIHAENVGVASMLLGAGRKTKDDVIDLGAGIVLKVKIGDYVDVNQPLATMYTSDSNRLNDCEKILDMAFKILDNKFEKPKLIHTMIK